MRVRAQSETLGFVFVFALITMTVGSVYALGVPSLQAVQDAERTNNMERAFEVLDDNIEDIVRHDAPSRATEVKLAGGSLSTAGSTQITLDVTNTTDPGDNASFSMTTRPISYSDGDGTTVAYSDGAIVRSDDGAAVMNSDPDWLIDDRRAVIPFLSVYSPTNRTSIGGRTTVLVLTERRSNTLGGQFRTAPGSQARVNVTVESPHAEAWGRYFEREGMTKIDGDATDGNVTYKFTTDTVYVPRVSIAVSLSG